MGEGSRKRSAIEPPATLFEPDEAPRSRGPRPASLTGGTALLVLRALASALWIVSMARSVESVRAEYRLDAETVHVVIGLGIGMQAAWMLMLLVFAWLVWRGSNWARMTVLLGATVSILIAAIDYFAAGEAITVRTTLLTLSLDILILLALSSREARAWSRWA